MPRTVLLTGFAPFAGAETNSSWLAVQRVAEQWGHASETDEDDREPLQIALLPVEFGEAGDRMDELIQKYQPSVVVAVGLAEGRDAVTPERVAININDARIADNAGETPIDRPIVERGPAAYFSTLPIKAAVAAVSSAGIRSHVSQSAGTFVCNCVFYRLMRTAQARGGIRAGFVHVPLATEFPGVAAGPTMPLADIATALRLVVRTSLDVAIDITATGGAVS